MFMKGISSSGSIGGTEPCGRSADDVLATVFFLLEDDRPAGELTGRLAIGRINEESKDFDFVRFRLGVNRHQAEAAAFLMGQFVAVLFGTHLRVADGVNVDVVPQPVEELARVGQAMSRTIPMLHTDFVGSPPARVSGSDGRRTE